MRDYNIQDAQEIIQNYNPNFLRFDDHIFKDWFERGYSHQYVAECLFEKIPLGINKTTENRFKLIYPHEKNKNLDLYIFIEIGDYRGLKVMTAYDFDKRRRERMVERR